MWNINKQSKQTDKNQQNKLQTQKKPMGVTRGSKEGWEYLEGRVLLMMGMGISNYTHDFSSCCK